VWRGDDNLEPSELVRFHVDGAVGADDENGFLIR